MDAQQFRQVMGNFAAGVTVVTLPEPYHGITVNAFTSLSIEPTPTVLICIDHGTETYDRLSAGTDGYCVNVLAGDQRHLGEHFARIEEHDDPFTDESTGTAATGAPIFRESLAYLDCEVVEAFEGGDHTIYVGEVLDGEVLRPDAPALTYFRGAWGSVDA